MTSATNGFHWNPWGIQPMTDYEAEERAWRDKRAEKEIRAGAEEAEPQPDIKPLPCPYPDCNPNDCVRR